MLNGQVVVISGGLGRLGFAFSQAVVKNGGMVAMGDVNSDLGRRRVAELGEDKALFFCGDLTESETIDEFVVQAGRRFGKVDAAVHCAYPVSEQWGTRFEELKSEGLEKDLFLQLGGAILFSQRMVKYFRHQGHGNLVHISSIQGAAAPKFEHYEGTDIVSPIEYSAIKAGVAAITRYLAKYCKGENIRVNCVSPGGILTDQPKRFLQKYKGDCLSKGMLDVEDIVGALLFLLSHQSQYVSGQNIIVDDGWSL
jgi:NAD(P)-dependent dehydrogenase (short-subunit alcohol dehydrogenase family)